VDQVLAQDQVLAHLLQQLLALALSLVTWKSEMFCWPAVQVLKAPVTTLTSFLPAAQHITVYTDCRGKSCSYCLSKNPEIIGNLL